MKKKHLKSMTAFALAVVLTTAGVVSGMVVGKGTPNYNSITIYSDLPDQHGD